jgi:hypothetical protein
MVESYLPRMLGRLIKVHETEAFAILSGFESFSQRLELLKALTRLHDTQARHSFEKTAISRLLPRMTAMTTLRNRYAHGRYGISFNDDFVVDSFIGSRKPKNARKSLDAIVEDVNTFKRLINDLHGFVYRDEMPPT